ncbi:hypothetical protein OESDEN_16121 [Oesophagostomum dentatum]|uniref:Major facilitator superfamily (MFS) profile domain-containing protein n=1 Tax=Oesophagostomum dentatum TaxID=61180 RepID=A0A0B1SGZ4_OESDE|nr:hypothetical protein OESDEN_16121 [Oesophagostomum dentatum]
MAFPNGDVSCSSSIPLLFREAKNILKRDLHNEPYIIFTAQESWAISVVAVAALVGNFPVVHLVNRVGIRTVFAGLGILSALSTLLIPTCIRLGFYWFLVARFLQGFAFSANFPVIGSFCAKWSYFKQVVLSTRFLFL